MSHLSNPLTPLSAQRAAAPPVAVHQRVEPASCQTLGNWQLVERAGAGQFSTVFFGRPVGCEEATCDYAIKQLRSEFADDAQAVARFRQEAVIGISVEHENLATVLSAHFETAPKFIVMPRLRGGTLAERLRRAGPLDVPSALWVARQAVAALQALHDAGWVHADIKSENLFVAPDGHVTVIDFGLAVSRAMAPPTDQAVQGTFAYAAPETFTTRHGICPASDIYSLGVVLYEILTGIRPFRGNESQLVEAHIHELPVSLRSHSKRIPKEVAQLVSLMLSKAPDRRPGCDQQLLRLLTRLEIDQFAQRDSA